LHDASVRVRHMPRGEHDCAGTRGKLVLTDAKHVLPLDHIEELVLIRVYMEGSIERIHLFDDRERAGGGLGARFDQEDGAGERQTLSSRRVEVVAMGALVFDGANLARGAHARPPGELELAWASVRECLPNRLPVTNV
jgi:hypothetical protein